MKLNYTGVYRTWDNYIVLLWSISFYLKNGLQYKEAYAIKSITMINLIHIGRPHKAMNNQSYYLLVYTKLAWIQEIVSRRVIVHVKKILILIYFLMEYNSAKDMISQSKITKIFELTKLELMISQIQCPSFYH